MRPKLTGWDEIVYIIIREKFREESFFLTELYNYEDYFQSFYPHNFSIRSQLRKTLVHLRERGLLEFQYRGVYRLLNKALPKSEIDNTSYHVFIASNEAMPSWVLVGHAKDLKKKLRTISINTPLAYEVIGSLKIISLEKALLAEKLVATIIETLDENSVVIKKASKRNFYQLDKLKVSYIFRLVSEVFSIVNS